MRERGRIVLAKGRPKREIRDAAVGGMLMYLMDKHLQLIIVLVRLCNIVLVLFSRIYTVSYKFHSFASPEPGSCVRVQRVQTRSAVNVERPSASAAYAKASFTDSLVLGPIC